MATEKRLNSRVFLKHDIEENWNKATGFIPEKGEVIIYDKDSTHDYIRFKIGDGAIAVPTLDFVGEKELANIFANYVTKDDIEKLASVQYVDDALKNKTLVQIITWGDDD